MSAPQHTPGPWTSSHDEYCGHYDIDADSTGETIAQVHYVDNASGGRAEADARLIAAAPELLEAWIEWFAATEDLAELERQSDVTKRFDIALNAREAAEDKARAAIRKARGEA